MIELQRIKMAKVWVIAMALVLAPAASTSAMRIRLKQKVTVPGPEVTLREVARVDGPDDLGLGDLVVAHFDPDQVSLLIALPRLRQDLSEHDVNWARLSLGGYAKCHVERVLLATTGPDSVASICAARALANPTHVIELDSPETLRDHLIKWTEERTGVSRDELSIHVTGMDSDVLATKTARHDRFEFEPASRSATLGRIPIAVRQYRAGQDIRTYRLIANVARSREAVVLTQGLSKGREIRDGDFEIQTVYVDHDGPPPLSCSEQVVGRMAASLLRSGAVLYPKNVRSKRLVRRGDVVDVRCLVGGLVVRTVARAMLDGSEGELIEVRSERPRSRETFTVRVTGRRQTMLDLDESSFSGPVPPEEGAPARLPRSGP